MEENKNQPNNSTENTKKELNEEFIAELFEKFENKGIIIKEAVVQGGVRKEYIKEKDFSIFVEKEKEYVINELNQAVRPKLSLETKNISHSIIKTLVEAGFLLHAVPHDYDRKPKYPKKLNIVKGNCCEESECSEEEGEKQSTTPTKPRNFYVLNFKRPEKKSYFWLTTIIVIVLGFCMMPIWPIEVKLAIWWVSWIILIGIVSFKLFITIKLQFTKSNYRLEYFQ